MRVAAKRLFIGLCVAGLAACAGNTSRQKTAEHWPTQEWRTSSPEAQGMDSAHLAKLFEFIDVRGHRIDSVLIVRHGVLVVEAYLGGQSRDDKQELRAATRSIIGTLTGIAIHRGELDTVDRKVGDSFPERRMANDSAEKRAITVQHLLQMTSGFEQPDYDYGDSHWAASMGKRRDWVQAILDQPMFRAPGERFFDSVGDAHLLSAIITKSTGRNAATYARQHLFGPLGITDVSWASDPAGHSVGAGGLALRPRDVAKIGQLYLRDGRWENKQILPPAWPRVATQSLTEAFLPTPQELRHGYLWWVKPDTYYVADGHYGQFLAVVPKQDIVVVVTGRLPRGHFQWTSFIRLTPTALLDYFILPAVKSDGALPANADAETQLRQRVQRAMRLRTAERPAASR